MSLRSERCKTDPMRKSSNGALPVDGVPPTKKFLSGMRFFENVAGGMMRARSSLNRKKKRASAIVTTFKPGWTCTMRKKEERRGKSFDLDEAPPGFYIGDTCDDWSD